MSKHTQQELRRGQIIEKLANQTLYYSIAKKDAKTLSFFSNDRLLVYDDLSRSLYYINDIKCTPFLDKPPSPKNNLVLPLVTSIYTVSKGSQTLQVKNTQRNEQQELVSTEWNFTFDSPQLALKWLNLLDSEKDRLVSKATGVQNAGFTHDVLLNNLQTVEPMKKSVLKPEQQISRAILQSQNIPSQSNIKGSQINNSRIQPQSIIRSGEQSGNRSQIIPEELKRSQGLPVIKNRQLTSKMNEDLGYLGVHNVTNSHISNDGSNIRESINRQGSNIKKSGKSGKDWNKIFLQNPTQATIFEFEQYCKGLIKQIWSSGKIEEKAWQQDGLTIRICSSERTEASDLKKQFRNYHFILEACKSKIVIGVPLCTLIEHLGMVVLIKCGLPDSNYISYDKAISSIRQLQRYTRIANTTLLNPAKLYDMTEIYGRREQEKLIYVDFLQNYLPQHPQQSLKCLVRPQYLLDHVEQVIPGGDWKRGQKAVQKTVVTACGNMDQSVQQLSHHLSKQQLLWVDSLELKDIFHEYGVNLKSLGKVYGFLQNNQVKKQVHSVMAAKAAKDIIFAELRGGSRNSPSDSIRAVEDYLKYLMGASSMSNQIWKEVAMKVKKSYAVNFNHAELIPFFFLNSLVKLLRLRTDCSRIDHSKRAFKDEGVIQSGFVMEIQPKIKSYIKFTSEFIDKIRFAAKEQTKPQVTANQMISDLDLTKKDIPVEYTLGGHDLCIRQYLANYHSHPQFHSSSPLKHIDLYRHMFSEPPTTHSLKITLTYLKWAKDSEKVDSFRKGLDHALKIADFWLDENHLYISDLYQLKSEYHSNNGQHEEAINSMKESLSRCVRTCGAQAGPSAVRYYELGEVELRAGKKRQAMDNFNKAKIGMESNKTQSTKYPQLLMRTAALHLNSGNIDSTIENGIAAIKSYDQYDRRVGTDQHTEGFKVKTYELLARAYQVGGRKNELKDAALVCARRFNRARTLWAFEQVARICVTAAIFRYPVEQCEQWVGFVERLQSEDTRGSEQALKELKSMTESIVVLERFLVRFEQSERIIAEENSKRAGSQDSRQFINISRLLGIALGQDYLEGLLQQKQYE